MRKLRIAEISAVEESVREGNPDAVGGRSWI